MTTRLVIFGSTDWTDGEVLYAADLNATLKNLDGALGEIKMVALSMANATTLSDMQRRYWAICDGTTAASQGITSATITTAPDMQDRFVFMSNDETSGTTGNTSHTHLQENASKTHNTSATSIGNWYELVFFIKVKI